MHNTEIEGRVLVSQRCILVVIIRLQYNNILYYYIGIYLNIYILSLTDNGKVKET